MVEKRLLFLDGWRGSAILAVVLGHFATIRGINLGRAGVELFFVLSGRLMAEILFVRGTQLREFFPRRFARIYPALFAFASIISVIAVYIGEQISVGSYLAAITLIYNYYSIYGEHSGILDHIWSLSIEEHLYIILGCLAALYRRWRYPVIPILLGLALLLSLNGAFRPTLVLIIIKFIGAVMFVVLPSCLVLPLISGYGIALSHLGYPLC